MNWIFDHRLPRAKMLHVKIQEGSMFARFRLANAMQIHLGRIVIRWRMPWLADVARGLHPELFPKTAKAQKAKP